MDDLQEIFNKIQALKKEMKQIKDSHRDALTNTPGYANLQEELKKFKEKIKSIEKEVAEGMSASLVKLGDLKIDLESEQEMLSDLAFNKLVRGELVEVKNGDEEFEPIFTVKFKKK